MSKNGKEEQERELYAIWTGTRGGGGSNVNSNSQKNANTDQSYLGPPIILEVMKHLSSQERIQAMTVSRDFADVFRGFYRKNTQRTSAVQSLLSFVRKHKVTVAFTLTKPGEVDLMLCFTTFTDYYDRVPRLAIYTQDRRVEFPCPPLLITLNDLAKSKGFDYDSELVENRYIYRGNFSEASWAWMLNFHKDLDDDAALAVLECLDMLRQAGYKETKAGTYGKEPGRESLSSPEASPVNPEINAAAEKVFENLNFYRVKPQIVNNTTNTNAAAVDADERSMSILQGIVARAKLAQDSTGLLNSKTAQFLHERDLLNPVINARRDMTLGELQAESASQTGTGSTKIKYRGKTYTVRVGKRGGRYILVQGEKIYVPQST